MHGEGDQALGNATLQIATLEERQTRYVMRVKPADRYTRTAVPALILQAQNLPHELYRSLTGDRGEEMASHKRFSLAADIQVYFSDPQNPWQRRINEHPNGLLRQ